MRHPSDLPAGPAFVIDYVMEYAIADGEPVFRTETAEYWLDGEDHLLLMTCFSDANGSRPDDDWLSIAETLNSFLTE